MAVTFNKYNKFLLGQMGGVNAVDFDTDTIKVALFTNAHVPAPTTATYFSDLANEVTGAGYTAGGATLSGVTLTEAAGAVTFDASDVTWAANASGFATARYAVIYKATGTPGTSRLIAYIDLGVDKTNVGGDLVLQWSASGIMIWQ